MEQNANHRILYQESRPLVHGEGLLKARLSCWTAGILKVRTLHIEITRYEEVIYQRHEVVDVNFDDALAQRYAIEAFDRIRGDNWNDEPAPVEAEITIKMNFHSRSKTTWTI